MSHSYINFLSCATCHGFGSEALFQGILSQEKKQQDHNDLGAAWFKLPSPQEDTYLQSFEGLIKKELSQLKFHPREKGESWGLILASTKGLTEDFVWDQTSSDYDCFTPVIEIISENFPAPLVRSATVSNACTSSHGAMELGQKWLNRKWVDNVLIVAIDMIGPFTLKGFQSLRALSESHQVKPFAKNRDGLLLGDGLAICTMSQSAWGERLELGPVKTLCEGNSATRPDVSGKNLLTCYQVAMEDQQPDLVIAHGTGTHYNDLTESNAICNFINRKDTKVFASKWSVGHTLGVSGLVDLCVAKEILNNQTAPALPGNESVDLEIDPYLSRKIEKCEINEILISSLGFGGMCSALRVWRVNEA